MFMIWKEVIAINIAVLSVVSQFENQYLGHHFTFDEYNHLELACDTKICLRDAQRLRLAATQNNTIEPCADFKEFSLGQFIKLGALDDRKDSIGFMNDVYELDWERIRKVLAAKITKNDITPLKVAKNYYRKCVNSDYVRENGTVEILQRIQYWGGAPFLNASWDENHFDIKELFVKETHDAVYFFLQHDTTRCPHPQNNSEDIFCLKSIDSESIFIYTQMLIDENVYLFKGLTSNKTLIQMAIEQTNEFIKQANSSQIEASPGIFTISELNNYTHNTFDWLVMMNSQLTIESQLTDESEIYIENPELILKLLELIKDTPKSILADIYAFQFLYKYKQLFIVYSFDEHYRLIYGTNKSEQRWLQCSHYLYFYYGPAVQALCASKYFRKEILKPVSVLTKEVVKDFMTNMFTVNDFSDEIKKDIINRLNKTDYLIGYPQEALNLQKIEEFYEELNLDGTEGSVETYIEIYRFGHKIENIPPNNWKKKLSDRSFEFNVKYYSDDNILYIPSVLIQYPYYHPNRSRFFNTATLFKDTANALNSEFKDYLEKHWDINNFQTVQTSDLAYNNYVKWEESGGKDLMLPGFFLTNRQMFWVALANTNFYKIHPNNDVDPTTLFKLQHFHVIYKNYWNFRDAYNCSDLNEEENQLINVLEEGKLSKDGKKETEYYDIPKGIILLN